MSTTEMHPNNFLEMRELSTHSRNVVKGDRLSFAGCIPGPLRLDDQLGYFFVFKFTDKEHDNFCTGVANGLNREITAKKKN